MPMFPQCEFLPTILAFTVADFLLIIGAGLLLGRNARVLKYYYEQKKRIMS
jgi:hypothetical protein